MDEVGTRDICNRFRRKQDVGIVQTLKSHAFLLPAHLHWARIPVPVVGIAILAKVKILHSSYSNALGIVLQLLLWSSCRFSHAVEHTGEQCSILQSVLMQKTSSKPQKVDENRHRLLGSWAALAKCHAAKFLTFTACNSEQPRYRSVKQVFISLQFSSLPLTFKNLVHFLIFSWSSENCIAISLMLGPYQYFSYHDVTMSKHPNHQVSLSVSSAISSPTINLDFIILSHSHRNYPWPTSTVLYHIISRVLYQYIIYSSQVYTISLSGWSLQLPCLLLSSDLTLSRFGPSASKVIFPRNWCC